MTYGNFLEQLQSMLFNGLKECESIQKVRVLKNNGVYLDGFAYQRESRRERPTIYVNHYYDEALDEKAMRRISQEILELLRKSDCFPQNSLEALMDPETIKKQVYFKLISREKNKELLKQVPWLPWLDMALVYYLRIPERIIPHATALIYEHHLECWHISLGYLHQLAMENMKRQKYALTPIEHYVDCLEEPVWSTGMYVVENEAKDFGAAGIVLAEVQKLCCEKLRGDFYVIPSSIHEVIVLSASLVESGEALDELIRCVNASTVREEEYLSDHAYFFDFQKKCFQEF